MAVAIDRSGTDKWRYTCPRGHTNWELCDSVIVCQSCPHGRIPGSVSYTVVVDRKTDTEVDVDEVRLL